jgi:[ribosomal protein S18]-alanine N-acetyltransferase
VHSVQVVCARTGKPVGPALLADDEWTAGIIARAARLDYPDRSRYDVRVRDGKGKPWEALAHSPAPVHVRWMIRPDVPEVLACGGAMGEEAILTNLRKGNVIGMVADRGGRVRGHMLYRMGRSRLYLIDFAVNPADRRLGVGTAMTDKLKRKLSPDRRNRIALDVPEWALTMQLFLKAQGFIAESVDRESESYHFVWRL